MSTEVPGDFSLRPFLAINRNFLTNSKISIGDTLFEHAQSFYCWHTWFKKSQSKEKSFYHLQVMMQIARYGLLTHKEESRALLQLLELQEKLFNSELHTSQISIETEKILADLTASNPKSLIALHLTEIEMNLKQANIPLRKQLKQLLYTLLNQIKEGLSDLKALEISRILEKVKHSHSQSDLLDVFLVQVMPFLNRENMGD